MAGSKKGQGKGRRFVVNPGKTAEFYRKHPESAQHHRDVESARSSTPKKKRYRAGLKARADELKISGKGTVKPGDTKNPPDIIHPTMKLGSRKKNRRQGGVHKN